MYTYLCESCGCQVDIEEAEVLLYPHDHEHYENGKCIPCFEEEK